MTLTAAGKQFKCRVSSVLNKDTASYGKQNMFDGQEDTCWNSESGSPQWVIVEFEEEISLNSIDIQFQGGFVGTGFHLQTGPDSKHLEFSQEFHPEDVNSSQHFALDEAKTAKCFKLIFNSSTDFFGRIIVYKLYLNS